MLFTTPEILVVDDEELNREIMALRLETSHYNLRFAVNGQNALDEVDKKKPDLILLDIMMPQMSGLQVLNTLRQRYSMVDLPIIMVTALDEDQRVVKALELGANDYVTKPINFPVLMARLQTQLSLKQLSTINREFLSTASQDLRKPLSLIMDITSQSLHKASTEPSARAADLLNNLNLIGKSASYINNITECILDMQTSGFGQLRLTKTPINLENLINETLEKFKNRALEKHIRLNSSPLDEKLVIEADHIRIAQVLDNYVGNAIKYGSSGDDVRIIASHSNDQVCIEVEDTGPGLTEQDLENLFNDNTSLSNKPTGGESSHGLGLPLCKQLIELHDGEIGAHNNDSGGSTFWFKLPKFTLRSVD